MIVKLVQAISCFAALKQRLGLRFPNQGTAADSAAVANEAGHAAADLDFALRIAKDAARRMPRSMLPPSPPRFYLLLMLSSLQFCLLVQYAFFQASKYS